MVNININGEFIKLQIFVLVNNVNISLVEANE